MRTKTIFTGSDNNTYIITSQDKDVTIEHGTITTCISSSEEGKPNPAKKDAIYINGEWYLFEENLKFTDVIDQTEYYIVTETRDERDENGNIKNGAVSTCISIDKSDTNPTKKDAIYVGNTWYIIENLQRYSLTFMRDKWNRPGDPNINPTAPHNRSEIEEETLKKLGLPKNYAEFQKYKILYQIIQAKNEQGIIEFLKKEDNKGLDFKGFFAASNGESLLYSLAKHNFFNAINILKEYGYDVTKDEGYKGYNEDGSYTTGSALYIAAQKGHSATIESLKNAGYDLTTDTGYIQYNKDGKPIEEKSALFIAAQNGNTATIEALKDAEYDLNQDTGGKKYDKDGSYATYSALYIAAQKGHTEFIKAIKDAGYNLTTDTGYIKYDKNGKAIEKASVLFTAAQNGHTATIEALIEAGYNPKEDKGYRRYNDFNDYETFSSLYAATQNGHTATIEAFKKAGYDLTTDTRYKRYDEGDLALGTKRKLPETETELEEARRVKKRTGEQKSGGIGM